MKSKLYLQPKKTLGIRRKLRKNQTEAEARLWSCLRKKGLGYKFVRQYGVGKYILDFYCPLKKLAIEIDGSQHAEEENELYDTVRTKYLESGNIRVLRFWNNEVLSNMDGVLDKILEELEKAEDSF